MADKKEKFAPKKRSAPPVESLDVSEARGAVGVQMPPPAKKAVVADTAGAPAAAEPDRKSVV